MAVIRSASILAIVALIALVIVPNIMQWTLAKAEQYLPTTLRKFTPREIYRLELYKQLKFNYIDYRIMSATISCESNWNEMAFNAKSNDFGLFQINYKTWNDKAKELGFENYTDYWKDNISMGVWIFKNSGIQNWNWSKHCWKSTLGQ